MDMPNFVSFPPKFCTLLSTSVMENIKSMAILSLCGSHWLLGNTFPVAHWLRGKYYDPGELDAG